MFLDVLNIGVSCFCCTVFFDDQSTMLPVSMFSSRCNQSPVNETCEETFFRETARVVVSLQVHWSSYDGKHAHLINGLIHEYVYSLMHVEYIMKYRTTVR